MYLLAPRSHWWHLSYTGTCLATRTTGRCKHHHCNPNRSKGLNRIVGSTRAPVDHLVVRGIIDAGKSALRPQIHLFPSRLGKASRRECRKLLEQSIGRTV